MSELRTTINEQLQQLQMLMHRAMFHHFGKMHSPHRGQGRVLAILKLKPEISQKELTYLLNMSKQAVAELIAKLEKNDYVSRKPSEEDKRILMINLTEKGSKAAEDVDENTLETTKVFDCFNDNELAIFSEFLARIIKRCEEQFPEDNFEERRKMMVDFISSHRHGFGGDCHGHTGMMHPFLKNEGFENDGDDN